LRPSTSTFTVPSANRKSCTMTPMVPLTYTSSGVGSFVFAFFWAAREISLSRPIASSSAAMLFSRPTNRRDDMCGKTMMSRSGSAGSVRRAGTSGLPLSCLKNMRDLLRPGDFFLLVFVDDQRLVTASDHVLVDHDFLDSALRGHVIHDIEHRFFED